MTKSCWWCQSFQNQKKKLIQEVQTICKLPAVNPATSAAGRRSFSSARPLKMCLPFRMSDLLAVLNGHKPRTDRVSIATQEFVSQMRIEREALALRATSKSSNHRKVYLTYWLYWIVYHLQTFMLYLLRW